MQELQPLGDGKLKHVGGLWDGEIDGDPAAIKADDKCVVGWFTPRQAKF